MHVVYLDTIRVLHLTSSGMSHTKRKRSCAFKWFSTRVSAVQLSLCDRMFAGSEKKTERGGEGCFFFNDIDPKPLTIHRTRPLGTEVSESESEWDGLTCCSVSTSTNGKPASVSSVNMTSKRMPNVSMSSTNLKELPVYESASESKTESVTEVNDVSGDLKESGSVSEESPALCLLEKELHGIRVMSSAIADSPDASTLDHYRSHLQSAEKYLTTRQEQYGLTADKYNGQSDKSWIYPNYKAQFGREDKQYEGEHSVVNDLDLDYGVLVVPESLHTESCRHDSQRFWRSWSKFLYRDERLWRTVRLMFIDLVTSNQDLRFTCPHEDNFVLFRDYIYARVASLDAQAPVFSSVHGQDSLSSDDLLNIYVHGILESKEIYPSDDEFAVVCDMFKAPGVFGMVTEDHQFIPLSVHRTFASPLKRQHIMFLGGNDQFYIYLSKDRCESRPVLQSVKGKGHRVILQSVKGKGQ